MLRTILICVASLAVTVAGATEIRSDIAYGPAERNVFDLYLPDGDALAPVVVFVHGGRWFRNDKTQVQLYGRVEAMNEAGFAVVSIDHTYSTQAIWPAQKEDVASALSYIMENGQALGLDTSRVAVWGQSSGAHLALWAALIAMDDPKIDVDAVVAWYAPSNLYEMRADRVNDDVPGANERHAEPSPESNLLGASVPENRPVADAASPERVFSAGEWSVEEYPSFFLAHGTADSIVSPIQSEKLRNTLASKGAKVSLRLVPGGGGWR